MTSFVNSLKIFYFKSVVTLIQARLSFCSSLLVPQLVHWFSRPAFQQKDATGKRSFLNAETALLVETLTDSTCLGDESSQVRERAAQGLSEFLIWNVKHSTDATLWADPAGPDFLFQKVRALATHPSPQQRLGRTVAVYKRSAC